MSTFATVAQFKAFANVKVADDDTLIGRLLDAATGWIRAYLNRDITQQTYTAVLDGTGTLMIQVPAFPIVAVTSAKVDGIAVDPANIVPRGTCLVRMDGARWTRGLANVVITYQAGFETAPAEIVQACLEVAAWRYREKDRIGQSAINVPTTGTNITFQTVDVPNNVKTLLNNYRKVVGGNG